MKNMDSEKIRYLVMIVLAFSAYFIVTIIPLNCSSQAHTRFLHIQGQSLVDDSGIQTYSAKVIKLNKAQEFSAEIPTGKADTYQATCIIPKIDEEVTFYVDSKIYNSLKVNDTILLSRYDLDNLDLHKAE